MVNLELPLPLCSGEEAETKALPPAPVPVGGRQGNQAGQAQWLGWRPGLAGGRLVRKSLQVWRAQLVCSSPLGGHSPKLPVFHMWKCCLLPSFRVIYGRSISLALVSRSWQTHPGVWLKHRVNGGALCWDATDFRRNRFGRGRQGFSLGYTNFEMSVRNPSGDFGRLLEVWKGNNVYWSFPKYWASRICRYVGNCRGNDSG